MKLANLTLALAAIGGITVPGAAFAHGGQYRGPGDTVPPGGGGGGGGGAGPASGPASPSTPGPTGPTSPNPAAPGASPGGSAGGPGSGSMVPGGADLTAWTFWWEFNKEPYLNLKSKIHGGAPNTGSEGFFLGFGAKDPARQSLRPTDQQIRQKVVPALLDALENETNNDIVTGCLVALAKIGDASTESGESEFEQVIAAFLTDSNQEIRETAAVALGILANPRSIAKLQSLLADDGDGRELVDSSSVDYRTRSFAAYGLGLIGANPASTEDERQRIVGALHDAIENDDTRSRDLRVAAIIALGLVPLERIEAPAAEDADTPPDPAASRIGQLSYLLSFLRNEDNHYLVRAHCPTALARLLDGLPAETYNEWSAKVAAELVARCDKKSRDQNEIQQSAVLALGLVGSNGDAGAHVRDILSQVPKEVSDQQTRNFSMIAMAKVGGRAGDGDSDQGIQEASSFLLQNLSRGKSTIKPWAGISIGVMGRLLKDAGREHPSVTAMSTALRASLDKEKDKQKLGAYAIGAGILQDLDSFQMLMRKLERETDDEARGYIALSLGLLGQGEAVERIQQVLRESKYRPGLLKQAAIGLGLLGDKTLVADLVRMLSEAGGLATQAAISSALGFIGDQHSIDPLVAMLGNQDITDRARGFAAVALGIVADKEPLPWNSKISVDLNYRASTTTLTDQAGAGILDIL